MSRHSASLANWQALSELLPESCLRIASYNVHGCVGTDGRKDAARIAEVVRELGCATLGNALPTRGKVLDVRRLALGYGKREPRNALDVDLEVGGGKLRVIVTHLGLFAAERRWQVRKLLEMVRDTEESLVV